MSAYVIVGVDVLDEEAGSAYAAVAQPMRKGAAQVRMLIAEGSPPEGFTLPA